MDTIRFESRTFQNDLFMQGRTVFDDYMASMITTPRRELSLQHDGSDIREERSEEAVLAVDWRSRGCVPAVLPDAQTAS